MICTNHHKTEDCYFYSQLNELIEQNNKSNYESRRCSLCHGHGHYINTCELRKKAKEFYKSKNYM